MTDASDDSFMIELFHRFGHIGHSIWWKLIEFIAKEGKQDGETWRVSGISWRVLRQKVKSSRTKLQQMLEFCRTNGKILWTFDGEVLTLECRKILALKDEYTRKSGHTPDTVRRVSDIEGKGEADRDKDGEKDILSVVPKENQQEWEPPIQTDGQVDILWKAWCSKHKGWRGTPAERSVKEQIQQAIADGIKPEAIQQEMLAIENDNPWKAVQRAGEPTHREKLMAEIKRVRR